MLCCRVHTVFPVYLNTHILNFGFKVKHSKLSGEAVETWAPLVFLGEGQYLFTKLKGLYKAEVDIVFGANPLHSPQQLGNNTWEFCWSWGAAAFTCAQITTTTVHSLPPDNFISKFSSVLRLLTLVRSHLFIIILPQKESLGVHSSFLVGPHDGQMTVAMVWHQYWNHLLRLSWSVCCYLL